MFERLQEEENQQEMMSDCETKAEAANVPLHELISTVTANRSNATIRIDAFDLMVEHTHLCSSESSFRASTDTHAQQTKEDG